MQSSPVPILVAVTLPVDRGPLEALLQMSSDANWQVHLLHAAPPPVTFSDEIADDQSPEHKAYEHGLYLLNDELVVLAKWFEEAGVRVFFRLEEGPIVATILTMAEEIDAQMIVIVGQRHVISHRAVLGSVASTLLSTADRPVLVLPTPPGTEISSDTTANAGRDAAVDRLLEVIERSEPDLDSRPEDELLEVREAAREYRSERVAPADSSNRFLRALHRFESEYPSLTRAINDVAYYLSGTGI